MDAFSKAWRLVKVEEPPEQDDPIESWRDDRSQDEMDFMQHIMENAEPLHPGFIRSGHHTQGEDMIHPWRWTRGDDADFHVQLKGNNAGRVLKEPIANSIGVVTNPDVLLPDYARYMFEHIHNTGAYQPYIGGSVVPFIRQADLDRVITEQMQRMGKGRE